MKSTPLTMVIVTFHNDFPLLHRLLESVDKFCIISQIKVIKIVLNDRFMYAQSLVDLVKEFTRLPIEIIPAQNLRPELEQFNWHSQQLFKCVVANCVDTDWYLLHDSKDFYVEPVNFDLECFTTDNRAIMKLDYRNHTTGGYFGCAPFSLAFKICHSVWKQDYQDNLAWHLPTYTPFFVKTEMMKNMVLELESITLGLFPYLFSISVYEDQFATEFFLYSAYCSRTNGLADYAEIAPNADPNSLRLAGYYNKIQQIKVIDVHFPPNPVSGEKFHHRGSTWVWRDNSWVNMLEITQGNAIVKNLFKN